MSLFSKKIQPLTIEQIGEIVLTYFSNKNPNEHFNENDLEFLAGTPQWTLVQTVDNYLLAKYNHTYYMRLRLFEQKLGLDTLPFSPTDTDDFNIKIFRVFLLMRTTIYETVISEIIRKVETKLSKTSLNKNTPKTSLYSFVKICIPELQDYEVLSSRIIGSVKEKETILEEAHKDNLKLLSLYLESRPEVAKKLKK